MADNNQNEDKYKELINQYSESRTELLKMLKDLDDCKETVLKGVAGSNDYRNKYAREERLKTLSAFFGNMLAVRQEYNRSIQTEIELRRKLDKSDTNDAEVDIRSVVKQLQELKESKNN